MFLVTHSACRVIRAVHVLQSAAFASDLYCKSGTETKADFATGGIQKQRNRAIGVRVRVWVVVRVLDGEVAQLQHNP